MKTILVTGATGYVGGRLIPRLLGPKRTVRVLVRDPGRVVGRPWAASVEIAHANMLTGEGLEAAMRGVHTAYYMIHSMFGGDDYARLDRETARRFAAAARKAGVSHIIYLGGLIPQVAASEHLTSRAEVGSILAEAVPTTELRAGPIVGSGSTSFEMVRYLTERLPLMIVPGWIDHEVQPISIRDTLSYLTLALDLPPLGIVDIGADRITFRGMVETYAELRGLRRVLWTVPALLPRLAARCIGAFTPIPNALAVPIVQGMVQPLVADTRRAQEMSSRSASPSFFT